MSQNPNKLTRPNIFPAPLKAGSKFTNPYNFVTWEEPVSDKYRRSYVSLDRYTGYSGRIECRLRTLTPFFVPSGEPVKLPVGDKSGHKRQSFSRLPHPETGQSTVAIQATSLKGMIRNIVETASNSCYSVFDPDQHYSYRPAPTPLDMGQAIQDPETGKWTLKKLAWASVKFDYLPLAVPAQARAAAKVETKTVTNRFGKRVTLTEVTALVILLDDTNKSTVPPSYEVGWIKATGPGLVENKRHEKFVYPLKGKGEEYKLDLKVVDAYNAVLKEQLGRREEQADGSLDGYLTRLPHESLKSGDIIYFKKQGNKIELGSVAVPRFLYEHSVGEYLPDVFHPCGSDKGNQKVEVEAVPLCPACRMFGWVRDAHKNEGRKDDANGAAIAGRVYFSHAYATSAIPSSTPDKTLAILGSPKPTTTVFYLRDLDKIENYVDYSNPAEDVGLRGRKFYWHFNPVNQAGQPRYLQPAKGQRSNLDKQNKQNSTVELLGADGSQVEFRFTIEFMNLEKAELGMLLWALEFDGEPDTPTQALRHKLGMGKPLGLGSVQLEITGLEIQDRVARYQAANLFQPASAIEQFDTPLARQPFKQAFKEYICEVFDLTPFEELRNVRDLLIMLNTLSIPNPSEIHYPFLPDPRDPGQPNNRDFESFRWFVRNNRRRVGRDALGSMVLPTPYEEIGGDNYRLPTLL